MAVQNKVFTQLWPGLVTAVVAAVVGAVVAYWLARKNEDRRRREEREKEREKEEQKQQAQEQQKLKEARAEILAHIRDKAVSFGVVFKPWTSKAAHLEVPPTKYDEDPVDAFMAKILELQKPEPQVSKELTELCEYYAEKQSTLEEGTRNIVGGFKEEAVERHTRLATTLRTTAALLQVWLVYSDESKGLPPYRIHPQVDIKVLSDEQQTEFLKRFLMAADERHESSRVMLEEQKQKVRQDADFGKNWDIDAHLHALEGEIERIEL